MGVRDAYEKLFELPRSSPEQHEASERALSDGKRFADNFISHLYEDKCFLDEIGFEIIQKNHLVFIMTNNWGIICNCISGYSIRFGPRLNKSLHLQESEYAHFCESLEEADRVIAEAIKKYGRWRKSYVENGLEGI